MTAASWTFRPVTAERWSDLAALFGGRGGPKTCWCMLWRSTQSGAAAPAEAAKRQAAMADLVQAGRRVGILGYDREEPVAWCSVAPRGSFGKSLSPTDDAPGLWSITCFFIRADHRRQAGFAALLAAAEDAARQNVASAIEAYPVDPDSPSYRFSGFLPSYEDAGYRPVGRIGQRRHIVRKSL